MPAPDPVNEPASPAPEARLAILLVEDTLEEALFVRTVLEDHLGSKVTLAQDGIRGCQLAENQRWDLVVTDLNIPGRDRMDVIRTSKEAHPDTPVLATTAYLGSRYLDQAARNGADMVLPKPLELEELIEKASSLTRARRKEHRGRRRGGGHEACRGGDGGRAPGRRARPGGPVSKRDPSVDAMMAWTREVVQRIRPDTVYTPSSQDVPDSRLRTHQAAVVEGSEIPNHYGYQAATTTFEFRPDLFIDVAEQMEQKLEIFEGFRGEPHFRPHLQGYIARSSARYWGRFLGYGEAEPLEIVRSRV